MDDDVEMTAKMGIDQHHDDGDTDVDMDDTNKAYALGMPSVGVKGANSPEAIPSFSISVPLQSGDHKALMERLQKRRGPGKLRLLTPTSARNTLCIPNSRSVSASEASRVPDNAVWKIRRAIYAQCKSRVESVAMDCVQKGLKGLDPDGLETRVLVGKLSTELAGWAVYGETPRDLCDAKYTASTYHHHHHPEEGLKPPVPLLARRREDDAKQFLYAKSSLDTDILIPSTNTSLRDAQLVQTPMEASAHKNGEITKNIKAILARNITGKDENGKPRPAAQILRRARQLASSEGVALVLETDDEDKRILELIIIRAIEADKLFATSVPSDINGVVVSDRETSKVLKGWLHEYNEIYQNDNHHLERKPIRTTNMSKTFSIQQDSTCLGYQCQDVYDFYWDKNIDKSTGRLPPKIGLPLGRDILITFLHCHQSEFFAAAMWRMSPDAVMPTCPAISPMLEGILPYHMGAHAILDQYTTLIRAAVDRFSPPGVHPPWPSGNQVYVTDSERISYKTNGALLRDRTSRFFNSWRAPASEWEGLPDWCGHWFLPKAFLPYVNDMSELEKIYPKKDPGLHPWVRTVVQSQSHKRWNYTATIDQFGALCTFAEKEENNMTKADKKKKKKKDNKNDSTITSPALKAYIKAMADPDRSRAGRAETLMGLVTMWNYHALLRQCVTEHDLNIDRIRERHGKGVDGGNGYSFIRPAKYYDELWEVCLKYLAQLLEIHELILLQLNSRWLNVPKTLPFLISMGCRLNPKSVANAHSDIVQNTKKRRIKVLNLRLEADGRNQSMKNGPKRLPGPNGTFPGPDKNTNTNNIDWTFQCVSKPIGRPDNPTYATMIKFDHLLDYVPMLHDTSKGKSESRLKHQNKTKQGLVMDTDRDDDGDEDPIERLSERMVGLMFNVHKAAEKNPEEALKQHALPIGRTINQVKDSQGKKRQQQSPNTSSLGSDIPIGSTQKRPRTRTFKQEPPALPSPPTLTAAAAADDDDDDDDDVLMHD